jgi:hypothetical protein
MNSTGNRGLKNKLTEDSVKKIEKLFNCGISKNENSYSFNIKNSKNQPSISIDIFTEPENQGLISVYSENSHLQLQSCSGFIISDMLEEVIFYSDCGDKISGLIISKRGDCALYSNVEKNILKSNFMDLNSEKLLSAVALSVLEPLND